MHVHGKGLVIGWPPLSVNGEETGRKAICMMIHGHGAKLESLGELALRGVGLVGHENILNPF